MNDPLKLLTCLLVFRCCRYELLGPSRRHLADLPFKHDPAALADVLRRAVPYWRGVRPPKPVDSSESWKCRCCMLAYGILMYTQTIFRHAPRREPNSSPRHEGAGTHVCILACWPAERAQTFCSKGTGDPLAEHQASIYVQGSAPSCSSCSVFSPLLLYSLN
jgi:hypothetical protein